MPGVRPCPVLALALLLCCSAVSHAQQAVPSASESSQVPAEASVSPPRFRGPRLHWNPAWKKVDTEHYILFGVGISLSLGKFLLGPLDSKRRGGVLVDERVRDAVRLDNLAGERFARDTSDVLLATMLSFPFFDALVVAGWYRRSPEVAEQIALISAEALGVTSGLQSIANVVASRERPFGRRCGVGKPEDGRDCDSPNRYFSFFSGHSSQSFTAAGVLCMHHLYLPLYGGGAGDALICGAGFAVASATAMLRVIGDQHYFSDVAVGALVGTLSGLGVPWFFHYRHGAPQGRDDDASVRIRLLPAPNGARLMGSF